jgi:DNA-3-methyladenine glycosylase I
MFHPRGLLLFISTIKSVRSGIETIPKLSFVSPIGNKMTTTLRRSARRASSSKTGKPTVAKKKTTSTNKKKSRPKAIQKDDTTMIPSKDSLSETENGPWYRMFTKGDEEYDQYMANEWGFEKVGKRVYAVICSRFRMLIIFYYCCCLILQRGTVELFEKISLEGAQSGLSWLTILRKREAYRRVFYDFDIDKVAAMTTSDVERILSEEDKANTRNIVVRHRGKIESVINNAKCVQRLLQENPQNPDYFDEFVWSFVNAQPILNTSWDGSSLHNANTQTKESQTMSKALKSQGFRFVGPTTMYAMMQSCGLVIDHPMHSPEWNEARDRLRQRLGGFQEPEP